MLHHLRSTRLLPLVLVLAASGARAAEPLLQNGGFESAITVSGPASSDQGFGVWSLAADQRAPAGWTLNPAFPGELSLGSEGAHGGQAFIHLRAKGPRGAHLYQPCSGVQFGKYYQVSAWVRGGHLSVGFYEYHQNGQITCPTVITASPGPGQWQRVMGLYTPSGEGFTTASLAVMAAEGEPADVDDVEVTEIANPTPNGLSPFVLENEAVRLKLSPHGLLEEFTCKATGANYATGGTPFFRVSVNGGEMPALYVKRAGDLLEVHFVLPDLVVFIRPESHARYLTLAVERVAGPEVEWVQFCDLRLKIIENVGPLVNAAWNDAFGACVLGCNDRTDSLGADSAQAALLARCYREFGLAGAKVAVIGVPLQPTGSTSRLLDAIEQVELGEKLPHLTLNGVWIKRSPARFASYLMAAGVGEANIDQVVEFAKGGFGCVELLDWWRSTPTYEPNLTLFPHGLAGMKACADKIHAAGMQVGMHCMQAMVGWGGIGMHDPHVYPKADPRLLQDRHATLAAAVGPEATELKVKEPTQGWPDRGDLFLEGEVIRYARRTDTSFADCTRGLHGTTVTPHPEGARVGHLVNCFAMWDNVIYAPDVHSTLVDEACDNIARVYNAVGADMSYFDAGEEIAVQPPSWHNQGHVAFGVQQRLKKPLILEGNALYTNLSWHVISRGSPTFDPIYWGRREYTLRFKGQNPAGWAKNLLTGDVGWFTPHLFSLSTDAVTPDEVMLLCLKALGGKAPISFIVDCGNLWGNRRMPEMLEIIRTCDELKRREYFSDEVCAALTKPMAEYALEAAPGGEWAVRPMQFGPERVANARVPAASEWRWTNPYAEQSPWVRVRARTRLAAYGAKENTVLADFTGVVPFKVDGAASPDLVQSVEPSTEKTPDGASAFLYRARNSGKERSAWGRLSLPFPQPLDLSTHRRLGLWVKGNGQGGLLNVQLAQGFGFRDHYIPLDFDGWAYRELDPPETARYYQYQWPYDMTWVMYWVFQYGAVKGINLYYNDLPPGVETSCLIGRIEALQEYSSPLVSPALEAGGQKVVYPVSVQPEEYLEVDWAGKCRHFERNGGLLEEVTPQGALRLGAGENTVRFTCQEGDAVSSRAEVTLAVRGEPLPNRKAHAAGGLAARPTTDRTEWASDGKGGFRLLRGLFELVRGPEPRSVAAFDGAANVWTVTNDRKTPCAAAAYVARGAAAPDANYDDPAALTLETFDDLGAYEMSARNQFEKYVIGGEKQLAACGPVRAGVTQTFVPSTDGARVGRSCGIYTAVNEGGPGGWCAKGKRFPQPLDLSRYEAVALWLCGDGKGETLRFQFRDSAGAYADWVVPIDFTGWRLQVFRTADSRDFDWRHVEYVIFYFNDLPTKTTATLRLDDLKALPKLHSSPPLSRPELSLNGTRLVIPVDLAPSEAVTVDDLGRCTLWRPRPAGPQKLDLKPVPLILQPGENRIALNCDPSRGTPHDVTVRVVPAGP